MNDKNYQILLEEVNRNQVKLLELWPNSDHIQNLKNLYLNNRTKNNTCGYKTIFIQDFIGIL